MKKPRTKKTGSSQSSSYRDTRSRWLQRMVRRCGDSVTMWGLKPRKSSILTETLRDTAGLCVMEVSHRFGDAVWKAMQHDGWKVVEVKVTLGSLEIELDEPRRKTPRQVGALLRRR